MTQIVVMPGGFHPFHAGHMALYNSAREAFPNAEVYVAATNDTSSRPFPFAVKEKLAKLAGVEPGKFIQVKSPFRANEVTDHYDPEQDTLIFVRSQKDAGSPPRPGGTKKDGSPAYLQPLAGAESMEPFAKHAYMAYLPTVEFGPGMTSATQIRTAWPGLNDKRKTALVMSLYPRTQTNPKLAATVVKLLDAAIGSQELAELRILHPADKPGNIDVYYRPLGTPGDKRKVVAKNIPYRGLDLLTRALVKKFNINPEDLEIISVSSQGPAGGSLNEFAPGGGDGDEDPYKYPKPQHYSRSIDFFGRFEADHFDREDMNDATGEFKGYWGKTQIAYFKFDNPAKTGSDDPGMGWYYEPEAQADDGNTAAKPAAFDNSEQRKQQELSMIRAFLKSGRTPTPGSQIYSMMKRHGMAENQGWAATYETNTQNFVGGMKAGYQARENQPVDEERHGNLEGDPELKQAKLFAKQHYPEFSGDEEMAFDKWVQRSLHHSEEEDAKHGAAIRRLSAKITDLQQQLQQAKSASVQEDSDYIEEKWSQKYKSSINCANPKGFSQRAHCAGRKK